MAGHTEPPVETREVCSSPRPKSVLYVPPMPPWQDPPRKYAWYGGSEVSRRLPSALRRRRRDRAWPKAVPPLQIHVGVRFGSDDAYRPRAAKETCGFGRRFHSGGKPDALDRPAGKAFQSFQAQRQVRATFGARDGVHFIHDNGINGGKYPSRLGGEQQEQRFWRGYEDIRRMADDSAPFLRRGVAASYAHADFRRWQSHRLALSGDASQWRLEVLGHIHARAFNGEIYRTLTPRTGLRFLALQSDSAVPSPPPDVRNKSSPSFVIRRSIAERKAHNVLPEPVGATTNTFSPERMAGHAKRCASVGALNACLNQALVAPRTSPCIRTYVRLWHRFRHHPQPAESSSSTVVGSFEHTARLTHSSVSHMASSGGRTVAALAAQSLMHGDHQRQEHHQIEREQVDRNMLRDQPEQRRHAHRSHIGASICMRRWPAICPRRNKQEWNG